MTARRSRRLNKWAMRAELATKEGDAFRKRKADFEAAFPTMKQQAEIARYVLARDPDGDIARGVMGGWLPLFEAYHRVKEAEAFIEAMEAKGLLDAGGINRT